MSFTFLRGRNGQVIDGIVVLGGALILGEGHGKVALKIDNFTHEATRASYRFK